MHTILECRKWKVRNEVHPYPKEWDKDKVLQFVNSEFRICSYCTSVDVEIDHYERCTGHHERARKESMWD